MERLGVGSLDRFVREHDETLPGDPCRLLHGQSLAPLVRDLRKRQVKAPKAYLRDSGILHTLLGIADREALLGHPKLGASWEGFALEEVVGGLETRDAYHWATHGGAELDLMVMVRARRCGFQFKHADAPGTSRSMRIALEDPWSTFGSCIRAKRSTLWTRGLRRSRWTQCRR